MIKNIKIVTITDEAYTPTPQRQGSDPGFRVRESRFRVWESRIQSLAKLDIPRWFSYLVPSKYLKLRVEGSGLMDLG